MFNRPQLSWGVRPLPDSFELYRVLHIDFRIVLNDPPPLVVARLDAFGHEWRESKLPDTLRRKGFHTATVARTGRAVELRLGPSGRGVAYVLEATVRPFQDGSVVAGRVRQATWQRRYFLGVAVLWPIAAAWFTDATPSIATVWAPALTLFGTLVTMEAAVQFFTLPGARANFELLVRHAAQENAVAAV